MTDLELYQEIIRLLATLKARACCQRYRVSSDEVIGELFLKLRRRATTQTITNPAAWVYKNGLGVLQNHLRSEHKPRGVPDDLKFLAQKREKIDFVAKDVQEREIETMIQNVISVAERLPKNEQKALRAWVGMDETTCRSLAKQSGLCPQTICNRANHAIRKMKTVFRNVRERSA